MSDWHYDDAGTPSGPHPAEHLRSLLAAGAITPSTLVWNPLLPDWRPAGDFPELLPLATAAAPPQPPPPAPAPPLPPIPAPAPEPPVQYATPSGESLHGSAVVSLVISILALLVPCFGGVLAIIAIIVGANALSSMTRAQNYDGRGLAITAIVLSVLAIVIHGTCLGIGVPIRWHIGR